MSPVDTELTHEYLLSVLDYDPATGRFIWKNSRRPGHNGKVAGKIGKSGTFNYAVIGIRFNGKDKNYGISRLAWFYVHGKWPESQLRFVNGNSSDARIENLAARAAKKRYKQGKRHEDLSLPVHIPKPQTSRKMQQYSIKHRFGITMEQYVQMLSAQKGVCAICSQPETVILHGKVKQLCIDHDHATGAIRSLLCGGCNSGLGYFKDSPELMARAIAYLRHHSGTNDNVVPLRAVTSGDGQ